MLTNPLELAADYLNKGEASKALPIFEYAYSQAPQKWEHSCNLGVVHRQLGNFDAARYYLAAALKLNSEACGVWHNYGMLMRDLGDFKLAEDAFKTALEIDSAYQDSHLALAECMLRNGRTHEAWPHWEAGRVGKFWHELPHIPLWQGENISSKHILITQEGGFGDTIFFSRWVKCLADQGAYTTLQARDPIISLLEKAEVADEVVNHINGKFDYYVPLLSIPSLWDSDIYKPGDYIPCDATETKGVGIEWEALEAGAARKNRSLNEAEIGVLRRAKADWKILNLGAELHEWEVTRQTVEKLERVVTVDTAVAHLAAAMGKETWVILPFASHWVWGEGPTSLWYSNVRLFRSSSLLGMGTAVEEVARNLNVH